MDYFLSHGQDECEGDQGLLVWLCRKYHTKYWNIINVEQDDMVETITEVDFHQLDKGPGMGRLE